MWDWFIGILSQILSALATTVGDWGLAVIILTVIIRIILTPLTNHSLKSTARMQVMQPKMKELQEKYADNPQMQQEEIRKLYADMKANPLGGCLPLLLQMPIFFGLFTVAKNVPANAHFFSILPNIADTAGSVLAASGFVAALPYIAFDVLFGVFTFVPMLLNLKQYTEEQRSQQLVMGAVMSVMMLWFGWSVPAAVLLYYVTSALWQTVQQSLITRRIIEKEKARVEAEMAQKPIEVDVVRKEKKPRPHKSSK